MLIAVTALWLGALYGTKFFLYTWLLVTAIISLSWIVLVFLNYRQAETLKR